jgi:PAS domain S-box-containing protein
MVEGLMVAAVAGIPSIGAQPPTLKFPLAGVRPSRKFQPHGPRTRLACRRLGQPLADQDQTDAAADEGRRLKRLIQAVTDYAIYMLDANGIVTSWNTGAERLKGYSEAQILGQHFSRFFTPEDRAAGKPQAAIETARRVGRFEEEGWRIRRDGTRFWALAVIDAIYEDGKVIGFAKVTRDLTDRHAAIEALRESEQRFRLLVEGVVDYSLFMIDRHGTIQNWNPGAQRAKGYTADEIVGRHFSVFYTEEDRAAGLPARALQTAAETGKYEAEGWRVRKDGTRFWASVVIDRILDEQGSMIGFAKITRDITERRQLERAKEQLHQAQKLETVGQLTGGVAHDFNNLLTAVLGSLSLIMQMTTDPRVKRLAETATRAADRGAKLTSQLLAFARRQTLRPQASDLNELITVFDALLRRAVGETVAVETKLEPALWVAGVDQAQFQSALLNLVVNARDAMPGGGTLLIETKNVLLEDIAAAGLAEIEPGPYVVVSVRDTGSGMTDEVRTRAIEPFYTTKDIDKGSGLGLSQVYGFARQSNGQLELESEPGRGTTVRLYLPRSSGEAEGETLSKGGGKQKPGTPSVLVVEDDPDVLDVTVETLHSLGYQVFSAPNAPEALTILGRDDARIDVLFADVMMPKGMNGIELAREARRLRPKLQILLASGYRREGLRDREDIAEDTVFLAKPYQLSVLAETLRQLTRSVVT